jgi:histidyl-tRNA synthetase
MDPYEEAEGWDDDEVDEPEFQHQLSESALSNAKNYKIHSSDSIEERQKKLIDEAKELLGISEDDAITSLKHFDWNCEKLQEEWFDNEAKTRKK